MARRFPLYIDLTGRRVLVYGAEMPVVFVRNEKISYGSFS